MDLVSCGGQNAVILDLAPRQLEIILPPVTFGRTEIMETHSSNGRRLNKGTVKHSPGGRKLPSPVQKTTQGDVVTNGDLGTRIGAKEQPIADSRGMYSCL